ncbi:S8 family serine peptidase [Streptomyces aurantiacus]|uniref:Putative Serine protease transporter B family protein tagB n=1 Tax=Streptomyces aurantiacus JA 4570 TaxID=1286094 RepID=S3ZBG5_9ACTN|nr:S8 family serine peptidase [Streptomyces aurantiacus]EPH41046.1 putative Serine protease transporter B family protein tagB [Streptomyces aurantiacus JA 4570]
MSVISVVGHLAGGGDRDAVFALLDNATVREDIVSGDTPEENLPALQRFGLVLHTVTAGSAEESLSLALPARHALLGAFDLPDLDALPPQAELPGYGETVILRTTAVPPPDWRDRLDATVLERVADHTYVVRLPGGRAAEVAALDFVRDLRPYRVSDTADPGNVVSSGGPPPGALPVRYEVLAHRSRDLPEIRAWLSRKGWPEDGAGRRKVRFRCRFGEPGLVELARRQDVAAVDLYVPPTLLNDHAQHIVGLRAAPGLGGLTGHGQIVGVADSGVDSRHPDLKSRLIEVVARGRRGDGSDPHGHGTHVAGTLAGDGSASGGTFRGAAPGASVFFQSVMDGAGRLTGLPVDLNDLLAEAYEAGARIHNNSWGAAADSVYRMSSLEIDEFVTEHPDMLVVVAAGNDGRAAGPQHVPRGFVDLFSVNAPATAKNALTVGASRSTRRVPDLTWREWSPAAFPDAPIGDERLGGDPEALAAFSSRGPCQEHDRIKPDLVAPGTCIVSARSALAPDSPFWHGWDDHYAVMGGTSMAAPLVAGSAALVREWFTTNAHTPSAALLKATLVNGTRWLGGPDARAGHPHPPNGHQGFGMLDLTAALPDLYVDTWADGSPCPPLDHLGQTARLPLRRTAAGPLRVCLTWTDPPGRGIQHALSLVVVHRPSGRRWLGNERRRTTYTTADTANNVQVVRVDAAEPGDYAIEVTAISELIFGPQDFALTVRGAPAEGQDDVWQQRQG